MSVRRTDTQDARDFWLFVDRTAAKVKGEAMSPHPEPVQGDWYRDLVWMELIQPFVEQHPELDDPIGGIDHRTVIKAIAAELLRVTTALEEMTQERDKWQEAMLFLRERYSPIGARPCPACEYRSGVFVRWCKLHEEVDGLRNRGEAAERDLAALRDKAEALKLEAQIHAQEARTANATIAEIYQACSGATGEPGNWHGAQPVIQALAALREERDEARNIVAAVNNAVIGSHGYFTKPSCVEAVEELKASSNRMRNTHAQALREAFRAGNAMERIGDRWSFDVADHGWDEAFAAYLASRDGGTAG